MALADIVFGVLTAFLFGVFVGNADWNFYFSLAIAATVGYAVLYFKKLPQLYLTLFLFAFFFGIFYLRWYENSNVARENFIRGQDFEFNGIIVSEPKFTECAQYFDFNLSAPYSGRISVFTKRIPEFNYGEKLNILGNIQKSDARNGNVVFFPHKVESLGQTELIGLNYLKSRLISVKLFFVGKLRQVLSVDSAALALGLTFGYQSDFSKNLRTAMQRAGVTHLVALSGYNIALVVFAMEGLLRRILHRRTTFILTALAIFLFVLMVGAEASVVRAAIMGFLVAIAKESGRIYSFRNALTLAAALMIAVNPTLLNFSSGQADLGFQLSFVSLLGIVLLEPAFKNFWRRRKAKDQIKEITPPPSFLNWRENLITTLAAQLAVIPILLFYFGEVSLTSFVANILILPLVPLTMLLSFMLAAVTALIYPLGWLLGLITEIFLRYEVGVIKLFAMIRLPISVNMTISLIVVYYAALIAFVFFYREKLKIK